LPAAAEADVAALKRVIEQVGPIFEAFPDSWFHGHLSPYRAIVALNELDVDTALAEFEEGVRRMRASGNMSNMVSLVLGIGLHRLIGDHTAADELAEAAVSSGQDFDPMLVAAGFAQLALGRWLDGERVAARELAMKARSGYAAMGTQHLALSTGMRRLWAVTSTEPRFADFERLVRLPPRAGALALMKGMFDELAMLNTALGRKDPTAEFQKAADELNAEFEAASDANSGTPS
jgi:hypothetical protein